MQALRHFYQKLGLALFPFRTGLLLACAGFGLSSVLLVFAEPGLSQRYLLGSLVAALWFLFLVALANWAAAPTPQSRPRGLLAALGWHLRKAWTRFLTIMFLLANLGLFYLTMLALRLSF